MSDSQKLSAGEVIERVFAVIQSRRTADPEQSYVAKLFQRGMPKIAQKVGEEAVEVAIASVSGTKEEVIGESADVLFHLMVMWAAQGIAPEDVTDELARREGVSGIVEKKSRNW
ncbi:phosphoribosyl-ATP diphosphatase [Govanella unica]|uniref:Phosphoribosyl-ATP pyrophosphatase n=1 Tax=Govanella unica TaxID=2975056 RepID=A0A9X3TZT3_9PROT|nr:phosphoribosyl-ATP diphosphatase [Govania unica]MDA5194603.1 phosphoribosyl-ATP diphosphatase [Govania unica]